VPAIQHNPRHWHAEDGTPITQRTSGLEQEEATQATIRYNNAGRKLRLDLLERNFEPATERTTMILQFSMNGANGPLERVSSERLIYRAIQTTELDDAAR
jgi:hypothetical protein